MPTLAEFTTLFSVLPEVPPPLPRKRQQKPSNINAPPRRQFQKKKSTLVERVTSMFSAGKGNEKDGPRPHPFMALKSGTKTAVIAVVDAGTPSFFRFGQGAFDVWPMFG